MIEKIESKKNYLTNNQVKMQEAEKIAELKKWFYKAICSFSIALQLTWYVYYTIGYSNPFLSVIAMVIVLRLIRKLNNYTTKALIIPGAFMFHTLIQIINEDKSDEIQIQTQEPKQESFSNIQKAEITYSVVKLSNQIKRF